MGPLGGSERPRVDQPPICLVGDPPQVGVAGSTGQAVGRGVSTRRMPALSGRPDHVAALAAPDVKGGAPDARPASDERPVNVAPVTCL